MPAADSRNTRIQQFEDIRRGLKARVLDQDAAIDAVIDAFTHLAFRPPREKPPRAIFAFLGPPGVGKVHLARVLSEMLAEYDGFRHFDMERYGDPESATQLLNPQIIQDEVREGELIRFLRETPRAVIVFDGIEKAANQIQMELLDLIGKDEAESGVNCREAVFIFTSALGSNLFQSKEFLLALRQNRTRAQDLLLASMAREKKPGPDGPQEAITSKLLATLGRNYTVLFNTLSLTALARIGAGSLLGLAEHFRDQELRLEFPELEQLATLLVLSLSPSVSAKKVRQQLSDEALFRIIRGLRQGRSQPAAIVFRVNRKAADFLARLCRDGDPLSLLFKNNQTIELSWKEYRRGQTLTFGIERADRKPVPQSRSLLRDERPLVEFSDTGFGAIAGNRQTKTTLKQIINILRQPEEVRKFAISMPRGMVLHGPPGVGKTLLAKAFAREAGRPYIHVARADLFDPEHIRLVYLKAREYAPSIVLLDGIDIKGLMEGVLTGVPADQLAMEIDALPDDPDESVFTLVTAVNLEEVPPLLIEPGRIDTFVEAPELDREARRFFINEILKKPNDGRIDVEKVVRYISGMNGYELQRIGKEAALYAIRHGLDRISEEILIEQINIIKYGSKLEKKHIRNLEEDLRMTAYHEAGHAVLSFLLLPEVKIEQVTIAPRLRTLGFISYSFEDFPGNISREEMENNICVLMAGRTASIRKFGDKGMDTGAASDLEEASHQAYTAIANLGMDEELGFVHADTLSRNVNRQLFREIVEKRVRHWIARARQRAEELVTAHWRQIETLAAILIRQEIVDGAELGKIMKTSRARK